LEVVDLALAFFLTGAFLLERFFLDAALAMWTSVVDLGPTRPIGGSPRGESRPTLPKMAR
jgi:hypothetical protein